MLQGEGAYGRFLGEQMAQAIIENLEYFSTMRFFFDAPRSWGNQGQWVHTPSELGVTPLWKIEDKNPERTWYLLDLYGADTMFADRK